MEFTQMTEVNMTWYKNYNLNQRGADTIHAIILTKYQKYLLILILKHMNVLAELIESHNVHTYKITPHKKCTVLKYTYAQWPYWKLVVRESFKYQYRMTKVIGCLIKIK